MIDISAIRASTDLVTLISDRTKLTRRGKEWYGLCPFHNEKTPSFTVVPAKQFYHCHGCGAHGDALNFVMITEGLTLPQAAARLGGAPVDAETKCRLEAEQRQRDVAVKIEAGRITAEIDLDWEASNWMADWGEWLRKVGGEPRPFV